jgi:hypothetical protein
MMEFSILLHACNPVKNHWRSYHIAAGRDLFGDWIVELTYGRIGSGGRTKVVQVADEEAARHYVRDCLKKRASAPRRIGISYQVVATQGAWE